MDKEKRRALQNAYKNRAVTGGVYCIECGGNHRRWLKSTTDMEGAKHRFDFSAGMRGCPEPSMSREFAEYGCDSFSFVILDSITKGETQTDAEFAADVNALLEIWLDREQKG